MLTILSFPNDILTVKAVAVDKITSDLQSLAKDMYETMRSNNGQGLAAPQVGHSIRLIVVQDNDDKPLYMFNPVILKTSSNKILYNEGCLSFIDQWRNISRAESITVKYRDINNKMQYLNVSGRLARVILHENDHLNGIVFTTHEDVSETEA